MTRGGIAVDLAFSYRKERHCRRHGPEGYSDYEDYRDWLRDEFLFRCVICLDREKWIGKKGKFHIDHVVPRADRRDLTVCYDNLVYVCARCNLVKGRTAVPDPCSVVLGDCVVIDDDGTIIALNKEGQKLIDVYRLDSREATEHRGKVIEVIRIFERDGHRLETWLGFPHDLPDLRRRRPSGNSRPTGVGNCYYVQREQNRIPALY